MSFRVTPEFKANLDRAAKKSGRSLAQEIELRLELSLDEERHLADALQLGFGGQVAGVILAIGEVIKVAVRPDALFEDAEAFRLAVESVKLLLELIDPGGNPVAWARLRKAFEDDSDYSVRDPEIFASSVAGAIVDPQQEEQAELGPLIPIIRNWFGAVLIERLRQRLGLPPPSQQ
jgi:uncharacterized protein (DUF1778 family)